MDQLLRETRAMMSLKLQKERKYMFNRFSRTVLLLVVLLFGGITAAHASISDTNQSSEGEDQGQWQQQPTIHYYMKTFLGKWNNSWHSGKHNKQYGKYYQSVDRSKQNNEPTEQPTKQPEKVEQPDEKAEQQVEKEQPTVEQSKEQSTAKDALNNFEQQVFELTNAERTKAGLAPLEIDYELNRVAREKSRDMSINYYFDHNSPVYGSPFDMIRAYGINYRTAGENIAKGQRSPQEVVQAWMNSPGHRANIMNSAFTHIGVGFVDQGNHWTQMFIGK